MPIVLCLFAGLLVTLAVGWACAIWGSQAGRATFIGAERGSWPHAIPAHWSNEAVLIQRRRGFASDTCVWGEAGHLETPEEREARYAGRAKLPEGHMLEDVRFGLPLRCLSCWSRTETYYGPFGSASTPLLGQTTVSWGERRFPLPIAPIWSGFAVNTLFYGTIAWVLLFLPGTLRRWRRVRAGRCVKCGYDRAGLAAGAACPECGGAGAR